jgi:hypothetical protein
VFRGVYGGGKHGGHSVKVMIYSSLMLENGGCLGVWWEMGGVGKIKLDMGRMGGGVECCIFLKVWIDRLMPKPYSISIFWTLIEQFFRKMYYNNC